MAELISTDEIKEALDALKDLNEIRKEISKKLGSLSVKFQLREKVVSTLYNYYEMVADDYYCLADKVIKSPETIELLKEGLTEQRDKLQIEMQNLKDTLEKPLAPLDSRPVLKRIDHHFIYQIRKNVSRDENKKAKNDAENEYE